MEHVAFIDVYNDEQFKHNAEAMLKTLYNSNRNTFSDTAIDFDDFTQEMWCQLFEEKRFNPDRAWCMEAIKCNAANYIRDMKRRLEITPFDQEPDIEAIEDAR